MFNVRRVSGLDPQPTAPPGGISDGGPTVGDIGESNKGSAKYVVEPKSSNLVAKSDYRNHQVANNINNTFHGFHGSGGPATKGNNEACEGPNQMANITSDRKRKDRHESCSQGQEKKVIRSVSYDDPKSDENEQSDVRRTKSNGNFGAQGDGLDNDGVQMDGDVESPKDRVPKFTLVEIDETSYGSSPQSGIVRNMPLNFEAEVQRQWERSAQWSSNSNRKLHDFKKYRSGSRPSSVEPARCNDIEEVELLDATVELVGDVHSSFDDDLNSPSSEESSSSSILSLDDLGEDRDKRDEDLINEDDIEADLEEFCIEEKDSSVQVPSNSVEESTEMEFSRMHQQMETNEPISFMATLHAQVTDDQVMLSPRNSVLIRDASDYPPSPPMHLVQVDPPLSRQFGGSGTLRLNQLSKQVNYLKKQLKLLEDEHERLIGYKPSHADKLNQKEMRKCLLQLAKAKRELKTLRDDPTAGKNLQMTKNDAGSVLKNTPDGLRYLESTVKEISAVLNEKRRVNGRPEDPAVMTPLELTDEKNSMQKQLLMLEKRHGRPCSREEKDIVRCLYDRYRLLKKAGARMGNVKENSIDLAPIMEHEPLEISPVSTSPRDPVIQLKKSAQIIMPSTASPKNRRRRLIMNEEDEVDDGFITCPPKSESQGFTEMALVDLESSLRMAKEEKRRLRVLLRKFEAEFQAATGRPPQKEEKYSNVETEAAYQKYKRCRATIRLLDVLVAKQKYPQLLGDNQNNGVDN